MNRIDKIVYILFCLMVLFYNQSSNWMICIIQFLFFCWYLFRKYKKVDLNIVFLSMFILSIPVSFVSILGTDSGSFPLTWYMFFLLILFVINFKSIKKQYLFLSFVFTFIVIISLFQSISLEGLVKQALMIYCLIFSFFIGYNMKKKYKCYYLYLLDIYLISVKSYVFQIVLQFILYNLFNIKIGLIDIMGNGRIVYSALFNDYSFASLYIATGLIVYFIRLYTKRSIIFQNIINIVFLTVGIFIVNSRTGLYSFAVVLVLYFILNWNKNVAISALLVIISIILVPDLLDLIISQRGGQALLDSSNRNILVIEGLKIFFDNPIIGIGLGLDNSIKYIKTIPHNFFVQYLMQIGIIGTGAIVGFFVCIRKEINYKKEAFWMLLIVLLGSMFIPDIVSSRYIQSIIIILFLN